MKIITYSQAQASEYDPLEVYEEYIKWLKKKEQSGNTTENSAENIQIDWI